MSEPRFINHPAVEWISRERLRLLTQLMYRDSTGWHWTVPAGFETDLASVPRIVPGIVRIFFGDTLATASAAILHDYAYSSLQVSRRHADALFYEALRASGETHVGRGAHRRVGELVTWHIYVPMPHEHPTAGIVGYKDQHVADCDQIPWEIDDEEGVLLVLSQVDLDGRRLYYTRNAVLDRAKLDAAIAALGACWALP